MLVLFLMLSRSYVHMCTQYEPTYLQTMTYQFLDGRTVLCELVLNDFDDLAPRRDVSVDVWWQVKSKPFDDGLPVPAVPRR